MEKQASGVFKSAKIVSDLLESDSPASPRARSCKTPSLWFALFLVLTFGLLAGVYFYLRRPRVSAFEYYRRAEQAKTPEEKIRFFTRALQADPYFRMAYYNRARVRKETGDHRGALKDLNKLVRVAADFGEGYRLRGILFKETGELEKAKDNFKKAASLKDSIYHIGRGISKIKAGDFENAREEFDRAIEKNPEQAVAFSNRGIARVHCGDLEGAIEDYSIAIRLQPDNTAALQNRAQAYEKTGDLESAENDRRLIEVINESKAGGDSSSSPRENGPKRDADVPGESG
jgi:tetratricopeptide (TPR) repeat protein